MSTELATRSASGIAELKEWGDFAQKAGVVPQGTTQPQAMAIIQTGREMGLAPMQSLRSMNFIKGRLVMSVQLQFALAKQKGVKVKELKEAEASCTVTLERAGEEITCTYTRDDAKKAGLLRDGGNYEKFPRQMLRWRCIGDVLRLIAPDLVMGLLSPEEAESIEEVRPTGSSAIQTEVVPTPIEAQEATQEKPKTTNYEFLKHMKTQKDRVGNEAYYQVLGSHGFEHANEIVDKAVQKEIYKALVSMNEKETA